MGEASESRRTSPGSGHSLPRKLTTLPGSKLMPLRLKVRRGDRKRKLAVINWGPKRMTNCHVIGVEEYLLRCFFVDWRVVLALTVATNIFRTNAGII